MEPELIGHSVKCKAKSETENPFIESLSKYELAKKTLNVLDKFNQELGFDFQIRVGYETETLISEAAKKWEPLIRLRRAAVAYENAKVQLERLAAAHGIDVERHTSHVSADAFALVDRMGGK